MEVKLSSVFITIVIVSLLTFAWRVLNWVWLTPKKLERCLREQGFKGNPYKLLLGDAKEIISMMKEAKSKPMDISDDDILPRVVPLHCHGVKLHGKNYFQWLGPTPRITITDPKLIKDMLFNHDDFRKPKTNPFLNLFMTGVVTYEGEKWNKHRNLLNPGFHLDKLKKMVPAMSASCAEMISRWEVLVSTEGSCEVDVWPDITKLTGDVISRTAFGSNYEEGKEIFELQRAQCELVLPLLQSPYIPGWRFLPTQRNRKMRAIYQESNAILTKIIKKKEQAIEEDEEEGNDLLGILLKTNLKQLQEHGNKKGIALTTEEVILESKLFYFAGQESTSVLLAWTMVMLSKHQKWQALAREEVRAVFGDNKLHYDGLNSLKIMTMILNEVLKLYSPAGHTYKKLRKETRLGELILPQGTGIYVPTIAIHRDPELWGEDAMEFNPQRFSEGVLKATKGQNIFFPFGGGPRICIGQNFAMVEAKIAIATILRKFSFQLSPSYVHAPYLFLTLQPQHGIHLILRKI